MSAYRCPQCMTNWPPSTSYVRCPECDQPTSRTYDHQPIDEDSARFRLRVVEFERWLARREAERAAAFAEWMTARVGPLESA